MGTDAAAAEAEIVTVRPATVKDADAVVTLLAEMGRPTPTLETRGAIRGTYERMLSRPEAQFLVAQRGGRVVGFCALEFRDRLNHLTQEAWVPELVVTESERGKGVGRALLEGAMREATERRVHRLTLETGYDYARAIRFYQHAGLTDAGKFFTWRPRRG